MTDVRSLFASFLAAYPPDERQTTVATVSRQLRPGRTVQGFSELMTAYPGGSFGNSIHRLHSQESGEACDRLLREVFPWIEPTSHSFGFDWLGRQFALDGENQVGKEPIVLLCDLVTREVFEIPATFALFHNVILVEKSRAALEADLFAQWAAANPESLPLRHNEIVGYEIPLALGGKNAIENMYVIDFDVELSFTLQIGEQIANVPEGTVVERVQRVNDR